MAQFEEPAECKDCGLELEAEDVLSGSLDNLDPDPGLDYWCPS